MPVHAQRDRRRAMAQATAHCEYVVPGCDQIGRVSVAKGMQRDCRQFRVPEHPAPFFAEAIRRLWFTIPCGEHQRVCRRLPLAEL
jgi:hypothetical protein